MWRPQSHYGRGLSPPPVTAPARRVKSGCSHPSQQLCPALTHSRAANGKYRVRLPHAIPAASCRDHTQAMSTLASVGTITCARLHRQPHATACRSYAVRKLGLNSQARTCTKTCARLHKQPHATACHSFAVRKLGLYTRASIGTKPCAGLHRQPHATHATAML
jgi:hypothetical protein